MKVKFWCHSTTTIDNWHLRVLDGSSCCCCYFPCDVVPGRNVALCGSDIDSRMGEWVYFIFYFLHCYTARIVSNCEKFIFICKFYYLFCVAVGFFFVFLFITVLSSANDIWILRHCRCRQRCCFFFWYFFIFSLRLLRLPCLISFTVSRQS